MARASRGPSPQVSGRPDVSRESSASHQTGRDGLAPSGGSRSPGVLNLKEIARPVNQAQSIFESVRTYADLQQLVRDRVQENIYLEFKTKKDRRTPDVDESDAFQFSRALSGFANSDGGVLLWGIESDREERACDLKPIAHVAEFESRLKKSLLNAVHPMVDGVEIQLIPDDSDSAAGFIKCLIPRSEKTPHRAMRAGREYYRRSTEGFYRLEHFDLEDAFGRRPRPVLSVQVQLTPRPDADPHEEVYFAFLNEGRGVAKHLGFTCQFGPGIKVVQARRPINDNSNINAGTPIVSYQNDSSVIHAVPIWSAIGNVVIVRSDKGSALPVLMRWYCEGMGLRQWNGLVSPGSGLVTSGQTT